MIELWPISIFEDNYVWALTHPSTPSEAWVVDPGDAAPVQQACEARGLSLTGIILTHHHWDHISGVEALCARYPQCKERVYASTYDCEQRRVPNIAQPLTEGHSITVFDQSLKVIDVPGHTLGHIAYFCQNGSKPFALVGDTLFLGGCGRLFEGSAKQMAASLGKLMALPDDTALYCTHEYTESNYRFAQSVWPDDPLIQQRLKDTQQQRSQGQPTIPVTLAEELRDNIFLRALQNEATLLAITQTTKGTDAFAALRQRRDQW